MYRLAVLVLLATIVVQLWPARDDAPVIEPAGRKSEGAARSAIIPAPPRRDRGEFAPNRMRIEEGVQ